MGSAEGLLLNLSRLEGQFVTLDGNINAMLSGCNIIATETIIKRFHSIKSVEMKRRVCFLILMTIQFGRFVIEVTDTVDFSCL